MSLAGDFFALILLVVTSIAKSIPLFIIAFLIWYWLKQEHERKLWEMYYNEPTIFDQWIETLRESIMVNQMQGIYHVTTKGDEHVLPGYVGNCVGVQFNYSKRFARLKDNCKELTNIDLNICYIGFIGELNWKQKIPVIGNLFKRNEIIQCFAKDIKFDYNNGQAILDCTGLRPEGNYFTLINGRELTKLEEDILKKHKEEFSYKKGWTDALNLGVRNTKLGAMMNAEVNVISRVQQESNEGG